MESHPSHKKENVAKMGHPQVGRDGVSEGDGDGGIHGNIF
jgi:hypothetical protein